MALFSHTWLFILVCLSIRNFRVTRWNPKNLRLHFKKTSPAQDFIIRTLPPYSIHCRCPFRVSEISSSFFPNLKIALLTFLCTSVNQTLTYIVLPLFLRQETVRRHDKKSPFIYLTYQKYGRFFSPNMTLWWEIRYLQK